MEPFRLCEWRVPTGRLFTCGRPGRSKGTHLKTVPVTLIQQWVLNLPPGKIVIVSLLGRKPTGKSEFSFYPFTGGLDPIPGLPTFEEWLAKHYAWRSIHVIEHPTVDMEEIPVSTAQRVAADILTCLKADYTVVLVDSGGFSRTGQICDSLGFQKKLAAH